MTSVDPALVESPDPLARWGLLELIGPADAPPVRPGFDLGGRVQQLVSAVATASAAIGHEVRLDPARELVSRANQAGWARAGSVSANRSARLLPTADGWLALNLARADDRALLPAAFGVESADAEWDTVARALRGWSAGDAAERAQLLGIPAAAVGAASGLDPWRFRRLGPTAPTDARPLVVDLSAMWAGPLCAHILHQAGARVITVEHSGRPDGARTGPGDLHARLHDGHESLVLDFDDPAGRHELDALIAQARVVVDSSRRRALVQRGIVAEVLVASRPGLTWVSITGYGRSGEWADRVAFGDDAAAAGGLVATGPDGRPCFVGDAIADPLTGMYAALGAMAALWAGGGYLVETAMSGVSAHVAAGAT